MLQRRIMAATNQPVRKSSPSVIQIHLSRADRARAPVAHDGELSGLQLSTWRRHGAELTVELAQRQERGLRYGYPLCGQKDHRPQQPPEPAVTSITRPSWASVAVVTAWPRLHEVYSQNQTSPMSTMFKAAVPMST